MEEMDEREQSEMDNFIMIMDTFEMDDRWKLVTYHCILYDENVLDY